MSETSNSDQRIQELLENGNRLLQEARDERAAHAETKLDRDIWRERALTFKAALRRTGPPLPSVVGAEPLRNPKLSPRGPVAPIGEAIPLGQILGIIGLFSLFLLLVFWLVHP